VFGVKNKKLPEYPSDHKVGMRVPEGGSDCAKCEYLDGKNCTQKIFIQWNGSEVIPAPVDEYCCDFFEAAKNK
jgi:hypothetical protein